MDYKFPDSLNWEDTDHNFQPESKEKCLELLKLVSWIKS